MQISKLGFSEKKTLQQNDFVFVLLMTLYAL